MESQNEIVLFIAVGSFAMIFFVLVIILFVMKYQRKMYQNEAALKTLEQLRQIELFQASVEIEEREKERISRNLHDEINPQLILLKQSLQKHNSDILKNRFNPEDFENDYLLIDKLTDGIRASSYELIPTYMLRYGLFKSLEDHVQGLNGAGKLKATFRLGKQNLSEQHFNKHQQLNLYRMCLELLNNVIKYSGTAHLIFEISGSITGLSFNVVYKGKGITNEEVTLLLKKEGTLGLKSLQARALLLNATIDYSCKSDDCKVQLSVPFPLN